MFAPVRAQIALAMRSSKSGSGDSRPASRRDVPRSLAPNTDISSAVLPRAPSLVIAIALKTLSGEQIRFPSPGRFRYKSVANLLASEASPQAVFARLPIIKTKTRLMM